MLKSCNKITQSLNCNKVLTVLLKTSRFTQPLSDNILQNSKKFIVFL
ncbi:hypothetical protein TPE_2555 [Treponema pedis str. T A4]|uniref:Uncharacterized protein n=1 Tax=Treponema pedis str. T A4 TaxID=1291379 RepID=S5ZQT8_9SPIR|nr:hypothetical protein TPE_2555 [Treponema pedis str. T A4]